MQQSIRSPTRSLGAQQFQKRELKCFTWHLECHKHQKYALQSWYKASVHLIILYTTKIQMFTTEILLLDLALLAKGQATKNFLLEEVNLKYDKHFPSTNLHWSKQSPTLFMQKNHQMYGFNIGWSLSLWAHWQHYVFLWHRKSLSHSNKIAVSLQNRTVNDWVTMTHSKLRLVHSATAPKAMHALNSLQSKTTSTWFKLNSCTTLPFITRASVTLHTHSPPLANIVLHTQHLIYYAMTVDLGGQHWTCLHGNLKRPCRVRLSALGSFQLQHKPDAIFMSCMNDGTCRRTLPPLSHWSVVHPWRKRNASSSIKHHHTLLHKISPSQSST